MRHSLFNVIATSFTLVMPLVFIATPSSANELSYDYLEAGYEILTYDIDGLDSQVDGNGFILDFSYAISNALFIEAGHNRRIFDEGIVDLTRDTNFVGGGAHSAITPRSDIVISGGLLHLETDSVIGTFFGSSSDTGFYIKPGIRGMMSDSLELNLFVNYTDVADETTTGVVASGVVHLGSNMALTLGYSSADDIDGYRAGLRYRF